jgi:uracil-DNA glycosylase
MSLTDHDRIITSLEALRAAEAGCVYHATARVVAGEGAAAAKLMMVGEQAGQQDLAGRPFLGSAGARVSTPRADTADVNKK